MKVFIDMQELEVLFQRYINKTASEAEKQEFFELVRQPGSDEILSALAERYPVPDSLLVELHQEASSQILAAILASEETAPVQVYRVHFIRRFRFVAAACFIFLAGLGSYLLFFQHNNNNPSIRLAKTNTSIDIKAPQTNRAMITLSTGQKIYLDSAGNGKLVSQGGVQVVKLADGQIVYSGTGREVAYAYNTLSNPRGSKVIDMTLSDGSHIWLNAGSTITYPVTFTGISRKVSMTGEAYFEVAHNAAKPFVVSKDGMEVEVLGTHFNVSAYDDEKDIQVTLLEGSVKVNKGSATGLLKPGEQALVTDRIKVVSGADLELIMAWKNGLFSFKGTDVKTLMRSIARWYDVEVDYAPDVMPEDETITGEIARTANISEVMKVLEFAGVHFKIEGKKITVKP